MKRIYVSTLQRTDSPGELNGKVYIVDWETKQTIKTIEVAQNYSSSVPDSKSHGCRGITIHDNNLWVAGTDEVLFIYDKDSGALIGDMHIENLSRTHQIKSHKDQLYIVSTGNNKRFVVEDYKVVDCISLSNLENQLRPFIREDFLNRGWHKDILHFNSIGWDSVGKEYHTYYSLNMIYNYTDKQIVVQDGVLNLPHDVLPFNDKIITSSSANRQVISYPKDDHYNILITHNKSDKSIPFVNEHGFTRGLAIHNNILIACATPTQMNSINLENGLLTDTFHISDNPYETIYDIVLDPEDWNV